MSAVCLSSVAGTQVRLQFAWHFLSFRITTSRNGSGTEQRHTGFVEPGRIGGGLEVLQDVMNQCDRKMNILNTYAGVHLAQIAAEYGGCPIHIGA
ncbi:hypothetical protein E4U24_006885 [Claviceps purpurea]|nr:hypothetical protein E4U24_006885 [Claviceps purpurea]